MKMVTPVAGGHSHFALNIFSMSTLRDPKFCDVSTARQRARELQFVAMPVGHGTPSCCCGCW